MVIWSIVFLFCVCSGMQYINIIAPTFSTDDIKTWHVSNVDDSPFERVELPVMYWFQHQSQFPFLFYDRYQHWVWLSPNGMISFAVGVPCECCFSDPMCSLATIDYQALIAPYLYDLVYSV